VADVSPVLIDLLTTARARGFLGPAPVERHIRHAKGFVLVAGQPPDRFLDLGAGGGIPGLFLLLAWPEASGVLLDSSQRRTEFLRDSTTTLGLEQRAVVLRARAEEAGRDPDWRGRSRPSADRRFSPKAVGSSCRIHPRHAGATPSYRRPPMRRPPPPAPWLNPARPTAGWLPIGGRVRGWPFWAWSQRIIGNWRRVRSGSSLNGSRFPSASPAAPACRGSGRCSEPAAVFHVQHWLRRRS
jgi:hypothetical protein